MRMLGATETYAAYYLMGLAGAWHEKGFPSWIDKIQFQRHIEVAKQIASPNGFISSLGELEGMLSFAKDIAAELYPSPEYPE